MEVIIKRSHKPDKKFDAVIDGKKLLLLVLKVWLTLLYIKIQREKRDILHAIDQMKIGQNQELKLLVSMRSMFYGTNRPYKHQYMTSIIDIRILHLF